MSLGATLANAVSGLGAASKRAELISSNIANALTPSYAKRDLDVSARLSNHGGVLVNGVSRIGLENLRKLKESFGSMAIL